MNVTLTDRFQKLQVPHPRLVCRTHGLPYLAKRPAVATTSGTAARNYHLPTIFHCPVRHSIPWRCPPVTEHTSGRRCSALQSSQRRTSSRCRWPPCHRVARRRLCYESRRVSPNHLPSCALGCARDVHVGALLRQEGGAVRCFLEEALRPEDLAVQNSTRYRAFSAHRLWHGWVVTAGLILLGCPPPPHVTGGAAPRRVGGGAAGTATGGGGTRLWC